MKRSGFDPRSATDSRPFYAPTVRTSSRRKFVVTCNCGGRGWYPAKSADAFPEVCRLCGGGGQLSVHRIAKLVHAAPGTLKHILAGRPSKHAAAKLVDPLLRLARAKEA